MRKGIFFISVVISAPIFILISPEWLKIQGVGPCWPVIWLLPFALNNGPFQAVICGITLGSILDSLVLQGESYIPALIFLGFWWGYLGKKQQKRAFRLNIGFLAFLGTGFVGLSLWVQRVFLHSFFFEDLFHAWAVHTFLAEMIITGLTAPIICSWIVFFFSTKKNNKII